MESLTQKVFHLICVKNYSKPRNYDENLFQKGFDESRKFFDRFAGKIDFREKKLLDVGCGLGSTCIYMAMNGAKKVVGVDIDRRRIEFARSRLIRDYQYLSDLVDFKMVEELGDEKFDVIISKDSFEHIADPENAVNDMQKHLDRGGIIAIGFGPLWKSPYGGHIGFMTKFPWAHLLFPEPVIMHERKRFRPEENAKTFEQIVGGLNKMTLGKFLDIMEASNLEAIYFRTNVSGNKLARVFDILSHLPFCREFFTFNLYSMWRAKT